MKWVGPEAALFSRWQLDFPMVYCFVLVLMGILKNAVWKRLSFVEIRSRDSSPPTSSSPPDHWLRKIRLQEGFQMPLPLQFWNHMKSCCRLCVYLYLMWYFERMNSMPCLHNMYIMIHFCKVYQYICLGLYGYTYETYKHFLSMALAFGCANDLCAYQQAHVWVYSRCCFQQGRGFSIQRSRWIIPQPW